MRTRILGAAVCLWLALALVPPQAAHATMQCVVPGDHGTIQIAVYDPRCDPIVLRPGLYKESVTIPRSVSIYGSGPSNTIVNGGGGNSVFSIANAAIFVNLFDMTISGGSAVNGGGINIGNNASVAVITSAVHANHAGSLGGGIFVGSGAELQLISVTIDANDVSGSGGGVDTYGGTVLAVNSTISGNDANNNGGGIANESGVVRLFNATIAFNEADADLNGSGSGGGIFNTSPNSVIPVDSIIANNLESDFDPESNRYFRLPGDCSGPLTSVGYNILSTNNCAATPTTGDKFNVDPKLGLLADNGGPTRTHALLAGSPAIDAGRPEGCIDHNGGILTNDQRLWARPYPAGGICDIGAYERGAFVNLPLISK